MRGIKAVIQACVCHYAKWKGDIKPWVLLGLLVMLCIRIMEPLMQFTGIVGEPINILEPFICAVSDRFISFFSYGIVLMMLCNIPLADATQPYVIIRTGRLKWILATHLYILTATFGLLWLMALSMGIPMSGRAFLANEWSKPAELMAFTTIGAEYGVLMLNNRLFLSTLPYDAFFQGFILTWLYWIFLSEVLLLCNMIWNRITGILCAGSIHIMGWFFNIFVSDQRLYRFSPMHHSMLVYHNFGGGYLPTVEQSVVLFLSLILIFAVANSILSRYKETVFYQQGGETSA